MKQYDFKNEPKGKKYLLYKNSLHSQPVRHTKLLAVIGYLIITAIVILIVLSALGGNDR